VAKSARSRPLNAIQTRTATILGDREPLTRSCSLRRTAIPLRHHLTLSTALIRRLPRLHMIFSRLNRFGRMRVPPAARAFPWVRFSTVVRSERNAGPLPAFSPVLLPPSNSRAWVTG